MLEFDFTMYIRQDAFILGASPVFSWFIFKTNPVYSTLVLCLDSIIICSHCLPVVLRV